MLLFGCEYLPVLAKKPQKNEIGKFLVDHLSKVSEYSRGKKQLQYAKTTLHDFHDL